MSKPWSQSARYYSLTILLVVFVYLFWQVREMINPLVIAGLIAYLMNPAVSFIQQRLRWRHVFAVSLVYFLSLSLLIALPAIFIPVLADEWATVSRDLLDILDQVQAFLYRPVTIGGYIIHLETALPQWDESLAVFISRLPATLGEILESTSRNAAWLLVSMVTIFYLLLDWDRLRDWFIKLAPKDYQSDVRHIYEDIKKAWHAYLRGQFALMFIVAVVFTIIWLSIGLPGAVVIGVLTGLFSLIPEIGPLIATALAVGVALLEGSTYLQMSNIWFAVLVVGIYLVLINFKNIWLRPRVMGRSVHLHEGLVFILIIAAVMFQGILGALIIVPVAASVVVVGRYLHARIFDYEPFPVVLTEHETLSEKEDAGDQLNPPEEPDQD